VSLCSVCNSDADWPSDIIVVYLREGDRKCRKIVSAGDSFLTTADRPPVIARDLQAGTFSQPPEHRCGGHESLTSKT